MSADREKTVVVAITTTAFHAETIAGTLRERGVDARVLDDATTTAWGMPMGSQGGVKVVVLEHERDAAMLALEEARVESASIDWDAVDLGSDPRVERLAQASKGRRLVWTVCVILVPAGLFVLSIGVARADPYIKIVGGTLLAAALALAVQQALPDRRA